jgi:GTP:adenosylcobinamide-phosphate guanylyltransferase
MKKKCLFSECGNYFDTTNRSKKYCSDECRIQYYKSHHKSYNSVNNTNLSTNAVGYVGELTVAIDLIKKGFQVFHSLYSADCDLIIFNDKVIKKIEVKTGHYKQGDLRIGKLQYGKFDILAIYIPENIIYFFLFKFS